MSAERQRARLARFWGSFALLVILRVVWKFGSQLDDEIVALTWIPISQLRARVGWLRPILWRAPFLDIYVLAFLALALACCAWLWFTGLQRWRRELRAAREER